MAKNLALQPHRTLANYFGKWVFGWMLLVSLTTGLFAHAQRMPVDPARAGMSNPISSTQGEGMVTLNFLNSNLEDVVKGVSAITGLRFMVPSDLKGKNVSLVTQLPIPPYQVYGALLSMLRAYRLVTVENDGIINIVPETEAWPQAAPAQPKDPDSQLVSKVIKFNYITAAVAANIIRPLLSQKGFPLVPNNNTNSLVVVDYASNLRNLETILNSLDQAEQLLPVVFPVNHLSVLEAESSLKNMLQSPPLGSTPGVAQPVLENIFADVPNNRLLVRADAKRLVYIAQLLAFVDVPRRSAALINVYPLKYTNAESMAKTLSSLLSSKESGATSTNTSTRSAAGLKQVSAAAANTNTTTQPLEGSVVELNGNGVNIQADVATNSLIIAAPENLYRNIIEIVRKLDVRRRQLYVEVLIADINGKRLNELGVQWMASNGINGTGQSVIGGTNLDSPAISAVAQNPLATGSGLSVGLVKGTISIPGVGTILNLGMLARALETQFNANILSSPNLLVLNNEESKLLVGTNVPIVTGQYTNSSSSTASSSPFQTIERKDVGVSLTIKPQIMESGVILLDLHQEVSDILSVTTQGPTTSKRTLDSKVLLDDGQIMVLGGLISERESDDIARVPVLGQIPILGRLFSYTKRTHDKSNLMLFIRPVILKDGNEAGQFADKKYRSMFNQLPYTGDDLHGWFGESPVVMPSLAPFQPKNVKESSKPPVELMNPANPSEAPNVMPNSPFVPEPVGQTQPLLTPVPAHDINLPIDLSPPSLVMPTPSNINNVPVIISATQMEPTEDALSKKRRLLQQYHRATTNPLTLELNKARQ